MHNLLVAAEATWEIWAFIAALTTIALALLWASR